MDLEPALFLTREYLCDVFRLESDRPRQYDWHIHALGSLVADATISDAGQNNYASRASYRYMKIDGGWDAVSGNPADLHDTPHLDGRYPPGGNVVMLDNHGEWRKWPTMRPRTQGGSPGFWW